MRSLASLCRRRRGTGSWKTEEEEDVASAPGPPTARPPPFAALLDAVAAKLGPVLQRLHEHESEVGAPIITTFFEIKLPPFFVVLFVPTGCFKVKIVSRGLNRKNLLGKDSVRCNVRPWAPPLD